MNDMMKSLLEGPLEFEKRCKDFQIQQVKCRDLLRQLKNAEEAMIQSAAAGDSNAFEKSVEAFINLHKLCSEYWAAKERYEHTKSQILKAAKNYS